MRRLILNMLLVMVATLLATVSAQTPSAEVSLPRNPVEGDRFSLTVTVNNPDGNIEPPSAPELEGCTLLGGPGVSTMSSTSIVNGRMQSTSSTGYSFTYRADREGTVKVPAIEVKVSGKTLTTRPGQFSILKASERQQGGQGGSAYPGRGQARQPQGQGAEFRTGPNDLFIRVELSAGTVYENQAVECVTKLYSINAQISGIAASALPTFDGCLIENLPTPTNIEWNREHFNGENYYTAVISRSLLYPQRNGKLTIGEGGEYNVHVYREMIVNDFPFPRRVMDDKDVTVKSRAATLSVTPLPQPAPAGFNGAVGRFEAETRLVGNTFKTNEAATLIYTIKGTGNIKYLATPQLDLPSEFELYDPHVENDARVSGRNMTGTMTVEYTFVPQSVGNFHIGGTEFTYFDPSRADYVSIALPSYDVEVTQGANVSSSAVAFGGKQEIEAKNTDIHFIKTGADKPGSHKKFLAHSTLFWCIFPATLLLLIVILAAGSRSRASRADVKAQRLNKAGKVARRRLSAAAKALKGKQYESFYAELLNALQGYLGDKLQIASSQLSRDNINSRLLADGADTELTERLTAVLDECEMARYTPQLSPEQADRTFNDATDIINRIETLKRR